MATRAGNAPAIDLCRGSSATTHGVRVDVRPAYSHDDSDPAIGHFVFTYTIDIANLGTRPVQLLSRRWVVVDANAKRQVVVGEGVLGVQPTILPGERHRYTSYVPLATRWGTMEGSYVMRVADGAENSGSPAGGGPPGSTVTPSDAPDDASDGLIEVGVARFYLVSPPLEA